MGRRMMVLLAMRDEEVAKRLCYEMDDEVSCTLRVVTDGDSAIRAVKHFRPDVLVLDCILPGFDGLAVIDRLRAEYPGYMPKVIGGAMMPFAAQGFVQRGADSVLCVPWDCEELRAAILRAMGRADSQIDWEAVSCLAGRAGRMLLEMGMRPQLRGFVYLSWAAALACGREARMQALSASIYTPVAGRFSTTPQSVERLIRHAVESAMDAVGAEGIYRCFGNTIDPTRGKPTNAQMIGMLAQRLKMQHASATADTGALSG